MPLDDTNTSLTEADETTALLIRARGFIERGWCRETAQDANGDLIQARSDRAVAWCAVGALMAAGVDHKGFWEHPATLRLIAAIDGAKIPDFNDAQTTVAPVLAAFDRAIAASQQQNIRIGQD
jgi:hypothetical protein